MSYEEDHGYEVFGQNLFMAATEREREAVVLKNDKKRRAFVEDPANWEVLPTADNFVRVSKMLYKEHMWLHIEIWQTVDHWNQDQHKLVPVTGWQDRGYYKINESTHALDTIMSVTNNVDEIKEIDRKEKRK